MILFAFILKHFLCDFPLQTPFMYLNKGKYGHLGGISHATIHALGTAIICMFFGLPLWFALVDLLVHYHIDWAKNQLVKKYNLQPSSHYFWWLLGADQTLHYATYAVFLISITA
ncbi:MAG: DUF3307 domain-containing protein [Alphaproteobacteria bacterium]|nr:DUF3307 domain-containing protein [Alphaproteobacteria bacterium]